MPTLSLCDGELRRVSLEKEYTFSCPFLLVSLKHRKFFLSLLIVYDYTVVFLKIQKPFFFFSSFILFDFCKLVVGSCRILVVGL